MAASAGVPLQVPPVTGAAIAYAQERHAHQRRSVDGAPFMLHPLEVAHLLQQVGAPDHVIAAGVLHDVIEKGGADAEELRAQFGSAIAELVVAVSEDPRIHGYQRRKAALRRRAASAGHEALMVYAADKVSKARELKLVNRPVRGPAGRTSGSPRQRLEHYRQSLRLLEDRLPGSPLVCELRAELERASQLTDAA